MNQAMFDASTNEEIIFKYFLDKLARNYIYRPTRGVRFEIQRFIWRA